MSKTDFGYQEVEAEQKAKLVGQVFASVAGKYDVMNDVMSLGIHRLWKRFAVSQSRVKAGDRVLDLAGGTGDLAVLMTAKVGKQGRVICADINSSMLRVGRDRLLDRGHFEGIDFVQVDAEQLPFPDNYFDAMCIGFGLRNVTDKQRALTSMYQALKPGGTLLVLEFSKPKSALVSKFYDWYSFKLLPKMGELIAQDAESYQYLAESIRRHPDQESLKQLMLDSGFDKVDYHNLSQGIVALHKGYKY